MLCANAKKGLIELRETLQETAGGSLLEMEINPALLLLDVLQALGLDSQEQREILGDELAREIETYLEQPIAIDIQGLPVAA
jgi:hypothetical protein